MRIVLKNKSNNNKRTTLTVAPEVNTNIWTNQSTRSDCDQVFVDGDGAGDEGTSVIVCVKPCLAGGELRGSQTGGKGACANENDNEVRGKGSLLDEDTTSVVCRKRKAPRKAPGGGGVRAEEETDRKRAALPAHTAEFGVDTKVGPVGVFSSTNTMGCGRKPPVPTTTSKADHEKRASITSKVTHSVVDTKVKADSVDKLSSSDSVASSSNNADSERGNRDATVAAAVPGSATSHFVAPLADNPNPAEEEGPDPADEEVAAIEEKNPPTFYENMPYEAYGLARGRMRSESPPIDSSSGCGKEARATRRTSDDSSNMAFARTVASSSFTRSGNHSSPLSSTDEFKSLLKGNKGFEIIEQEADGNCLFRAVAHQVYGDNAMHNEVRRRVIDYMAKNEEHFSHFLNTHDEYCTESFLQYVKRKRQDGVHGNHVEIQAISELYNRPVEVYSPENGMKPLNIFHTDYKTSDQPFRLSYHDGNHYNAVVDPLCPTAGLGLGLPGLQPGLADKLQMKDAIGESERLELDRLYVSQALKESEEEWSRTRNAILHKQKVAAFAAMDEDDCNANPEGFELEQAILQSSLEAYNSVKKKSRSSPIISREGTCSSRSGLYYQGVSENHANATSNHRGRLARAHNCAISGQSYFSGNHHQHHSSSSSSVRKDLTPAITANASSPSNDTDLRDVASSRLHDPAAIANADESAFAIGGTNETARSTSATVASSDNGVVADAFAASEFPDSVAELVMNGFPLKRVLRAYELIGDNFDDLLAFLMSSG